MSCEKCYEIQEANRHGDKIAFLRIDNANVIIGACDLHFNMLRQQLGQAYITENSVVYRMVNKED